MKCSRCKRQLGPDNTTGIGPICARMLSAGGGSAPPLISKIYLLGKRPDGSRRYLVMTDGKEFRVLVEDGLRSGETLSECSCRVPFCRHIEAVIQREQNEQGKSDHKLERSNARSR